MKKSTYHFLVFLLALMTVCGICRAVFQSCFGPQFYLQDPFVVWFVAEHIVSITGGILMLKYWYHQKYRAPLYTGVLALLAGIYYDIVFFIMLISQSAMSHYKPAFVVSLCATMVYALSLVISPTGKKIWLKVAGFYMLAISVSIMVITWRVLLIGGQLSAGSETLLQWVSAAAALFPVGFIIHFLGEIKTLAPDADQQPSKYDLTAVKGLISVVILITGVWVATEGYSGIYWGKQNFERAKRIVREFESRTYVSNNGDTLFYHLLKPLNFDAKKKYPLVISLPYGGQPGTDKNRQVEGAWAVDELWTDSCRKKYPAFILVPNCPPGSGWGGIANYPSVDLLAYDAIADLDKKEPGIDIKRQYVMGISRGGYGAWHFIVTRPDLFAAAIPVCGGDDPARVSTSTKVAVWAFHGAKDRNVPVSRSRDMINAMKKSGHNPKYTELANQGHNIGHWVLKTPGLWDWLFAQSKD